MFHVKHIVAAVALAAAIIAPTASRAESVCSTIGDVVQSMAEARDRGITRDQMVGMMARISTEQNTPAGLTLIYGEVITALYAPDDSGAYLTPANARYWFVKGCEKKHKTASRPVG